MSNPVNKQDWTTVVINKNTPKITGKVIEDKKINHVQGKHIDTDDGDFIVKNTKQLQPDKVQRLIQLRLSMKLDQKTLAKNLNIQFNDIKDAEQRKEIPLSSYQSIQNFLEKNKDK